MASLKMFLRIFDIIAMSMWGLTIMDLFRFADATMYNSIDGWIKTGFAAVGLIYLLFSISHKRKMQKSNREKIELENEKLKLENEKLKLENEKLRKNDKSTPK